MLRLGHFSPVGIGLLNLAFAATVAVLSGGTPVWPASLLLFAAGAMPAVCYLAAVWQPLRHLFILPAVSLPAASVSTAWRSL